MCASPSAPDLTLLAVIERIALAGVGLTTRALAEATPGWDLSFPQWRVLLIVGEGPEGATVSAVAERVSVTVPATSRQLRRLERRGLVEVGRDPADRRAARARLTASGRAAREAILAFRRQRILTSVSGVEVGDATLRELASIAGALDEYR